MAVYAYIKSDNKGMDVILTDSGSILIRSPDGTECIEIPKDGVGKLRKILDWFAIVEKQVEIDAGGRDATTQRKQKGTG